MRTVNTLYLLAALSAAAAMAACGNDNASTGSNAAEITEGRQTAQGSVLDGVVPRRDLPSFKSLDTDGDGYISRSEAEDRDVVAQHFDAADQDGDDKLSPSEYRALGRLLKAEEASDARPGS
jgi:hypothetical protein